MTVIGEARCREAASLRRTSNLEPRPRPSSHALAAISTRPPIDPESPARGDAADAAARGAPPGQGVLAQEGALRQRPRPSAPWTTSASRSRRAKRSAWSANRAAARRRPGRCILRLIEPTSGEVLFDGRDVLALSRGDLRRARRDMQIVFQDPYSSLNPRMRVADIVEEPLIIHKLGSKAERRARVQRAVRAGRAEPRSPAALSARVQRRSAAAHRPGARAGAESVADHRRRAGVGARRLGAGAGREPADGTAGAAEAHLPVHRARPAAGGTHLQPRRGDVSGANRGDGGHGRSCSRRPQHPYTRALLSAIPVPDPDAPRQRIVLDPASFDRAARLWRRASCSGLISAPLVDSH